MIKRCVAMAGIFLAGCAAMVQSPAESAAAMARSAGFATMENTGQVRGYQRIASPGSVLTVYIEGDGARWKWPDRPPVDPTPPNPLSLRLAMADASTHPAASVAYLGRPCQYLERDALSACDSGLWRKARFSPAAVGQMNQALDRLVKGSGASSIILVGYSGGGAIAALLAAHRSDVNCLVTIAAPLDTDGWTSAKGVSRLDGSLNPVNFAGTLSNLPQWHFMGGADQTVPPETSKTYLDAVKPASYEVIPGFDHDARWEKNWPDLLKRSCLAHRN